MGFFSGILNVLKKTRDALSSQLSILLKGGYLPHEFYEELEFALISADVGVIASSEIVEKLRERVHEEKLKDPEFVKQELRDIILEIIDYDRFEIEFPAVIMIVVGKTTTIGKLTKYFSDRGKSVVLAAGDTFRAAAVQQLSVWAERAKVRIIKQGEGADPSAVVYDAVHSAKSKNTDVLIIDTAGRLHNKANLMEELKKINRVINREYPECHRYNFIVLDATTGQNALQQARAFNEAIKLDGIILTKLDGTAKGGIVIAINAESDIPVRFIGTGEKIGDIAPFDAEEFVNSII
jgi:fused signal recognition particle receptor